MRFLRSHHNIAVTASAGASEITAEIRRRPQRPLPNYGPLVHDPGVRAVRLGDRADQQGSFGRTRPRRQPDEQARRRAGALHQTHPVTRAHSGKQRTRASRSYGGGRGPPSPSSGPFPNTGPAQSPSPREPGMVGRSASKRMTERRARWQRRHAARPRPGSTPWRSRDTATQVKVAPIITERGEKPFGWRRGHVAQADIPHAATRSAVSQPRSRLRAMNRESAEHGATKKRSRVVRGHEHWPNPRLCRLIGGA